ncbi:hypothetical protein CYMTET_32997 [Cymbomonas tetramitiformis]|uniref:Helitron helicase-like domain-containing protein n=1 Tax=Cymbomonas tetramitiformis TaxID=36881 RepID=A0AAE0FDW1_9CHLO|nr:hypothetical protein CYMTET_32997 [Cymbomonas tetramitiformis]
MHEAMLETDAEERNMDHDDASDVHHGGSVHVDRNGSTIIDDESRSDVDMDDACPSEAAIDDVLDDTDVHVEHGDQFRCSAFVGQEPVVTPMNNDVRAYDRPGLTSDLNAMKGTAAESVMIRKKLHATATRFGSHQLFVTITPDDLVDPIAAAYAGFTPSVNVDGLSDAEVQIKNRDDMANTIAANPVACAMAFRAQLRIFIEEIIGWNLSDGTSQSRVMAKVIAFNAQVEEQGGQNLHAHILVTVVGLPHTHEALLQKLREHPNMTLKGIIQYVEAVKCNNAFSDFACQKEFTACDEEACQMAGHHQFVSVAVPAHIKNTTKPLGYAFPEPHTVRCPYSNPDGIINGRNDNTG